MLKTVTLRSRIQAQTVVALNEKLEVNLQRGCLLLNLNKIGHSSLENDTTSSLRRFSFLFVIGKKFHCLLSIRV